MADESAKKESAENRTDRLAVGAQELLGKIIHQKRGNIKAWGDTILTLHWKGGELDLIKLEDQLIMK